MLYIEYLDWENNANRKFFIKFILSNYISQFYRQIKGIGCLMINPTELYTLLLFHFIFKQLKLRIGNE